MGDEELIKDRETQSSVPLEYSTFKITPDINEGALGINQLKEDPSKDKDYISDELIKRDDWTKVYDKPTSNWKEKSISFHLMNKLDEIRRAGNNWCDENIPGPNDIVLSKSKTLINDLVANNMIPSRITPTVEEGICFIFKNINKIMYLELYNDGEMGYIIEENEQKKILDNAEILHFEEILNIVNRFFG